jgi:hypothetical protein
VRHPARSYAQGIAGTVAVLVTIAGWITLTALKQPHARDAHVSIVARANAMPADSKPATPPVPARIVELKPAPAKLIFVTPADSKQVAKATVVRPSTDTVLRHEPLRVATARPVAVSPDSAAPTRARKVAAWANVRQEPSAEAAVVQVLRPGQQIDVVQRRGGWWAVYTEGRRLGYVSRTLLVDEMRNDSDTPVSN